MGIRNNSHFHTEKGEYGLILSWRKTLLGHVLRQNSHRFFLRQTGRAICRQSKHSPLKQRREQLSCKKHSVLLQVLYSPEFAGIGTLLLERHPQSYPQRECPVESGLFRAMSSRLLSPAKSWSEKDGRLQLKSHGAPCERRLLVRGQQGRV